MPRILQSVFLAIRMIKTLTFLTCSAVLAAFTLLVGTQANLSSRILLLLHTT